MNTEDIQDVLHNLGFKLLDKGDFWTTNAIWRNGDNNTAVQIYKNSGVWRDFVEGIPPSPFARLVSKVLGTSNPDVLKKYDITKTKNKDIFENVDRKHNIKMPKTYDTSVINNFLPHYKFYNSKGISSETLKSYKSGFSTLGSMNNRYVFPIFSFEDPSSLIGFSGRSTLWKPNQDKIPKWKHVGQKRDWVYPLCLGKDFKDSVKEKEVIYVVESIGDSLALTENGFKNHIVTFGLSLSGNQLASILAFNPKKIIIVMNNDKSSKVNSGLEASIKIYISLLDFFDIDKVSIKLPKSGDLSEIHQNKTFNEWTEKQINEKDQRKHILDFIKNPFHKKIFLKKANLHKKIELLSAHLNEDTF